jgi:transposase-like protein
LGSFCQLLDREDVMPTRRPKMRDVREVLRLHLGAGLAVRALARQLGLARSTVQDMLGRFGKSGLEWPLADDLSDAALEDRLYGAVGTRVPRQSG